MTEQFKQESRAVVRQVRTLALVLSAVFIVSLALILWNTYASRKHDAVSNYHIGSSQILRGIKNSFLSLKYDLDTDAHRSMAETNQGLPLTPHQKTGILYAVRTQYYQLLSLDEQNTIAGYEPHNKRLMLQMTPLMSLADNATTNPLDLQSASAVGAVLLSLEQLDRLHLIALEENKGLVATQRLWGTGILLSLLFLTTLLVARNIRKTFAALKRILKQQTQTAINLRREKDLLHTTLQSIGDAVITTDANGLITDLNPIAEQLTGWTLTDLQDSALTNIFQLVHATTREPIENPVAKVLETGNTIRTGTQALLVSRNGTEYRISYSAAAIHRKGKIQGLVLVFNDATEEEKLRESLATSRRNVQAIMENTPNLVYAKDIDGRYLFVNDKYCATFKAESYDIIGKTDVEIHSAESADQFRYNDMRVILENRTIEAEEVVLIDKKPFTYRSIKYPLYDENGTIYAVGGISADITESKNQDEIIRRSQKMDALGKLVGGVAHDYNNMLGVVIGYSDLLAEMPENSERQAKYIKQIRHSAKRGAALTKQLLQFSGRGAGEATALDINRLILDTQSLLGKTLTPKITIELQLDEKLWLTWLDSNGLEDVLLNLSINALHAIEGNGTLTIQTANRHVDDLHKSPIQLLKQGDYVVMSVVDTGCGMTQEIKEKIFDPFFSTKGDLGTGLGLSQVYGFVQQSGGDIRVDSKRGEGTRIDIYFPRFRQSVIAYEEPPSENAVDHHGTENILLVDDEIALLELAAESIELRGYTAFCASNAADAMKILETENIDLMISDVVMPDMDGYQLAALVQEKYPFVKIQMASGYSDGRHITIIDDRLHASRITKPYDSKQLLQHVRALLDS